MSLRRSLRKSLPLKWVAGKLGKGALGTNAQTGNNDAEAPLICDFR